MRATMEKYSEETDVPDVTVCVTKGVHDCGIRISDQGGGASREVTSRWFEYMYSTAPRPPRGQDNRVAPLVSAVKRLYWFPSFECQFLATVAQFRINWCLWNVPLSPFQNQFDSIYRLYYILNAMF